MAVQNASRNPVRYAASLIGGDDNDPRVKCLAWIRPGSRVLEIGCGHGAVTRLLQQQLRCSVVAVDLDSSCAESVAGAAERFVCGDVADESVRAQIKGDYDYVLLMDVLEHMASPDLVLSKLRECVGAPARFVVTLPNFMVWHVRLPILLGRFEYADSGTLDRTHLRFFTLDSARNLLVQAGLEVEHVAFTWNIPALGLVWALSQVEQVPNLQERARRRFGAAAPLLMGLVKGQGVLNRLGWRVAVDRLGESLRRAAPGMLTNHIALLAIGNVEESTPP